MQKKWNRVSLAPMIPSASPKSTCACPGHLYHHGTADLLIKFHALHPPPPPKNGGLADWPLFIPRLSPSERPLLLPVFSDRVIKPLEPPLAFGNQLQSEARLPVARHINVDLAGVGHHRFATVAIAAASGLFLAACMSQA